MSYRFMRLIVMFDLPVITTDNRRNYAKFRKLLIKNGFMMMQESVYSRMVPSPSAQRSIVETIKRNKPPEGLVQIMAVTEKQFSNMEYVIGESTSNVIDSDERILII